MHTVPFEYFASSPDLQPLDIIIHASDPLNASEWAKPTFLGSCSSVQNILQKVQASVPWRVEFRVVNNGASDVSFDSGKLSVRLQGRQTVSRVAIPGQTLAGRSISTVSSPLPLKFDMPTDAKSGLNCKSDTTDIRNAVNAAGNDSSAAVKFVKGIQSRQCSFRSYSGALLNASWLEWSVQFKVSGLLGSLFDVAPMTGRIAFVCPGESNH